MEGKRLLFQKIIFTTTKKKYLKKKQFYITFQFYNNLIIELLILSDFLLLHKVIFVTNWLLRIFNKSYYELFFPLV